jgi:hypothetical protein
LLLIVSVSWISFLIVGVLLAAFEVFLQRIKSAPESGSDESGAEGQEHPAEASVS